MFVTRFLQTASIAACLLIPTTWAQFGVAGGRRKPGASFQELQEMAKEQAAAAGGGAAGLEDLLGGMDMNKMQEMWSEMLNDPQQREMLQSMGSQLEQAMSELSKLSPEQLRDAMKEATNMLKDDSTIEKMLEQKDEILKNVEQSGLVPPDELAKMKADPEYLKAQLKESMGMMENLMTSPEYLSAAQAAAKMLTNPSEFIEPLKETLKEVYEDDGKLEEARQKFLEGDYGETPGLAALFESEEMKKVLQNPVEWKKAVREGFDSLFEEEDASSKTASGGPEIKEEL